MRIFTLTFAILLTGYQLVAQSDRVENHSTKTIYQKNNFYLEDAYRLALRDIRQENSAYQDSITIDPAKVEAYVYALSAIFNAKDLGVRDTLVEMYNIHCHEEISINYLFLHANYGTTWMNKLQSGIYPTGNEYLDSVINKYAFNIVPESVSKEGYYDDVVELKCYSYINMQALIDKMYRAGFHPYYQEPIMATSDIEAISGDDFTDFVFTKYYGDDSLDVWELRVWGDLSVEYLSKNGKSAMLLASLNPEHAMEVGLYPMPCNTSLHVSNVEEYAPYQILNNQGVVVQIGTVQDERIEDLNQLTDGQYILLIADREATPIQVAHN